MIWFHVPYRWLPRTAWRNISTICRDLFWRGPKNVIKWLPVIWLDVDWDHSPLLDVMEFKLNNMAKCHEEDVNHTNSPRRARQLRTAALLCSRINEDDYDKNAKIAFKSAWVNEYKAVMKQDTELLGKLISKHLTSWWC